VCCELDDVDPKVAKIKHICVILLDSILVEHSTSSPTTSQNVEGAMLLTIFCLFASSFFVPSLCT
jgi:Ca2+/H+ antiporter